ncbi:hypothetical protein SeMB42_g04914 [Synchytrium endobioticum]|uniref:Uncharacterized protein n=1 Tax=Synchytrium endobioticum TaxID=286115 RepID=A0A507CUX8_9FUNG|nr:hypothetical protein SeMB42_g04914 [Synchytrium endobioticum]
MYSASEDDRATYQQAAPRYQELENAATSGASTVSDPESVYTAAEANDDSVEAAKKKVLYTKKTTYIPQKGGYGGGMGEGDASQQRSYKMRPIKFGDPRGYLGTTEWYDSRLGYESGSFLFVGRMRWGGPHLEKAIDLHTSTRPALIDRLPKSQWDSGYSVCLLYRRQQIPSRFVVWLGCNDLSVEEAPIGEGWASAEFITKFYIYQILVECCSYGHHMIKLCRTAIQELENAATSGASTVPDPESVYTAVGANDDSEEAAKKKVLYTKKTIYNPQKGGYGGGMGGYGGRF